MTPTAADLLAGLRATRDRDTTGATRCTTTGCVLPAAVTLRDVPLCAPCYLDTPRSKR